MMKAQTLDSLSSLNVNWTFFSIRFARYVSLLLRLGPWSNETSNFTWDAGKLMLMSQNNRFALTSIYYRSVLYEVRRNSRVEQWTQPRLKCLRNLQTNDSPKVLCHSGLFPFFFFKHVPMAISAVFDGTWRPNMENNVPNFHKILRTTFVQIELKKPQWS